MSTVRRWLAGRRLVLVAAGLGILLCTPSLWLGLYADDYILWMLLADPAPVEEWSRPPWRAFAFFDSETSVRDAIASGAVPWWTSPDLRLAFFRPLAGLTHWIDFRLWPGQPWLMHVQSLLWLGATLTVAGILFRRLLRPEWVAGLALLVFAIDDAHGSPAVWIANRNATIGTLFALLALLAHDRWRRDAWRPGGVLAPMALVLGLMGGEIALAGGAYLLAYALFLDPALPRARVLSLLPTGLAGLGWALVYRALGFGASGSAMYIDPVASPTRFAGAVAERAPLLLFGQWALPSQLNLLLSQRAAHVFWLLACGLVVLLAFLLAPLLRRDRGARFFALGMLLSLLPACSTFPHDRLLFLAGFGGAGLLAQLLGGLLDREAWVPGRRAWRGPAVGAAAVLAIVHLLYAPIGLARATADLRAFGDVIESAAESLPSGPEVESQVAVIVQTPTAFVSIQGFPIQVAAGRPTPRRFLVLGSSIHALSIERPDERTLLVRPQGGYLLPAGSPLPGTEQPALDPRYLMPIFDGLYRDTTPVRLHERFDVPGASIQVTELTPDGRPAEARFEFDARLEDPCLLWLRWEDGAYAPFEVPPVGGTVTLQPPAFRLF